MRKHLGALFVLPLLLGALLAGVKWKQMHPTPTQLDLQERAHLRKATRVEIWNPTYRGQVPINEFKEALNEFYLLKGDNTKLKNATIPAQQSIFIIKGGDSVGKEELAMIGVSPLGYYISFGNFDSHRTRIDRSLRPATQRRFKKLIEENMSTN